MDARTSDRATNFEALKNHAMIGRWFLKLSAKDLEFCVQFLAETKDLSDPDFIFKVNRMYLGVTEKPKNWGAIADLLSATIDPVLRRRGRLL